MQDLSRTHESGRKIGILRHHQGIDPKGVFEQPVSLASRAWPSATAAIRPLAVLFAVGDAFVQSHRSGAFTQDVRVLHV